MAAATEQVTWWVPVARGVDRVAHHLPHGPFTHPKSTTTAVCGQRRGSWAAHTPGSDVPVCADCQREITRRADNEPEPLPPGTWWVPASLNIRGARAHLLPPGATGGRCTPVCGREGHIQWLPLPSESPRSRCHACEVLGGGPLDTVLTTDQAQRVGLVAASWCRRHGHGKEVLRELLWMLLERPGEARRAS